jgi:hypothetical protein
MRDLDRGAVQERAVEEEALEEVAVRGSVAVACVAEHGLADRRQVPPDLVRAAGL